MKRCEIASTVSAVIKNNQILPKENSLLIHTWRWTFWWCHFAPDWAETIWSWCRLAGYRWDGTSPPFLDTTRWWWSWRWEDLRPSSKRILCPNVQPMWRYNFYAAWDQIWWSRWPWLGFECSCLPCLCTALQKHRTLRAVHPTSKWSSYRLCRSRGSQWSVRDLEIIFSFELVKTANEYYRQIE